MTHRAIFRTIVLFYLLPSIGCNDRGLDPRNIQLQNVVWILQSFDTVGGSTDTIKDGRSYSISFVSDTIVHVRADCNDCMAIYHAIPAGIDPQISVNNFLCTKVYCGSQSLDTQFLNALSAATNYSIQGDILRVFYNERHQVLSFRNIS
jgi:hypothetical protein